MLVFFLQAPSKVNLVVVAGSHVVLPVSHLGHNRTGYHPYLVASRSSMFPIEGETHQMGLLAGCGVLCAGLQRPCT